MAKLNAASRNALPASTFGGPDRSYPMPDKSHAANAKARVSNKSPALKAKVDAKADKVLGEKKGTSKVPPGKGKLDSKTLSSMAGSLKF
jgi:hypothetical protein